MASGTQDQAIRKSAWRCLRNPCHRQVYPDPKTSFLAPGTARRASWLVAIAAFVTTLLLAGVLERFPPGMLYPLSPGTLRISFARGYVVLVLTRHVVLSVTAAQVSVAGLLALSLAILVRLAARGPWLCRVQAAVVSGVGVFTTAVGLSYCCGLTLPRVLGVSNSPPSHWLALSILLITWQYATTMRREAKVSKEGGSTHENL